MKYAVSLLVIIFFLNSCASGPIYMAQKEAEAIKTNYQSLELRRLHIENERVLRDIYNRFMNLKTYFVKEGLGIMAIKGEKDVLRYYLMVCIRPSEIRFDVNKTDERIRFSQIVYVYLPKYLTYIKKHDISNLDGLTFGIYWPVRDSSQCMDYGGFIEYAHFNIPKEELYALLDGKKDIREVLKGSEIITSFNLEPPKSVRIEF